MSNVIAFPVGPLHTKKVVAAPPSCDELSFVKRRREGRKRKCGFDYWAVTPA